MNHIGKTTEQKRHEAVKEFYLANEIRRKLQKELSVSNPYEHNYYNCDSILMREMKGWLRRLCISCGRDREVLGLQQYKPEHLMRGYANALHSAVNGLKFDVYDEKIMTLDESAYQFKSLMSGHTRTLLIPKYYDDLVGEKYIVTSTGSCMVNINGKEIKHYGEFMTLNARELKADWIKEQGLKAYKVTAIPVTNYEIREAVIGYVVCSAVSKDIDNAFGVDIHKAVSLCKRRTKKEVLKQMGV